MRLSCLGLCKRSERVNGCVCSVPRGGFGCSGLGRELGIGGLHEYTELKSVNCESAFLCAFPAAEFVDGFD